MNNQSKADESHQDNHQHQPGKHRKLTNDAPIPEATKITDLDDDCLMEISNHLNHLELYNVAVSNEFLREAARSIYKRKFATKRVRISCVRPYPLGSHYSDRCAPFVGICETTHPFEIGDLQTSLRFIRLFGSSVETITIVWKKRTSKWHDYVNDNVNKYCAASLLNISYEEKPTFWMNFEKPLKKVECVQIVRSDLGQHLPAFPYFYTNLGAYQQIVRGRKNKLYRVTKTFFSQLVVEEKGEIRGKAVRTSSSAWAPINRSLEVEKIHNIDSEMTAVLTLVVAIIV